MAGPTITGGNVSTLVPTYYDRRLLENLYAKVMLYNYATKKALPMHQGKTITFSNLSSDVGGLHKALTEGVAPTAGDLSAVQRSAVVYQFGETKTTSDLLEMTAITDVVSGAADLMSIAAAQTLEYFIREACFRTIPTTMETVSGNLLSGAAGMCMSSVKTDAGVSGVGGSGTKTLSWTTGGFPRYTVSAIGTSPLSILATSANYSAYEVGMADLRYAVRILRRRNVDPFDDGYYHMFVDSMVEEQLLNTADWATMVQTEPRGLAKWEKGVVGAVYGIKVIRNNYMVSKTDAGLSGSATYAHFSLILGKNSLAVTELEPAPGKPGQKAVGMTVVPRSNLDHANPLGQYSTIGWKMSVAATALNCSAGMFLVSLANGS
jgi:N4-gp56 family major capsid protein